MRRIPQLLTSAPMQIIAPMRSRNDVVVDGSD